MVGTKVAYIGVFIILSVCLSHAATTITPVFDKASGCLVYVDADRPQCNPIEGNYRDDFNFSFTIPSDIDANIKNDSSGWIYYNFCVPLKYGYNAHEGLNGYSDFSSVPPKTVLNFDKENLFKMSQQPLSRFQPVDQPYALHGLKSFRLCIYTPKLEIETTGIPESIKGGDKIEIGGVVKNTGDMDAPETTIKYVGKNFNAEIYTYTVDIANKEDADSSKRFVFRLTPKSGMDDNFALNGIELGQIYVINEGHTITKIDLGKKQYVKGEAPVAPTYGTPYTAPQKTNNSNIWMIIALVAILALVVVFAAGVAFYFFVYKKEKKETKKK